MRLVLPLRLDAAAAAELADALESRNDVVLLHGSERAFCLGMDLAAQQSAAAGLDAYVRCLLALRLGPPAVAFVDGPAAGGGVGLAAACDVVVTTSRATFALPEALFGLVPGAAGPVVVERIGPQRFRRMALTGVSIDAERALAWGLVDELAEDTDAAERIAHALGRAEPTAAALLCRDDALAESVRSGARLTLDRMSAAEPQRRIAAWLAGDAPWEAA